MWSYLGLIARELRLLRTDVDVVETMVCRYKRLPSRSCQGSRLVFPPFSLGDREGARPSEQNSRPRMSLRYAPIRPRIEFLYQFRIGAAA
jgi:hypothetical protein